MKPKCMTDHEYERWQFWNQRIVVEQDKAKSPCEDCPAWFARDMRSIDMCNGRPGGFAGPVPPPHVSASAEKRHRRMREVADRAFALYMNGMSQVRVAEEMGLSQSVVSKYIRLKRAEMAA